MRRRTKIIFAAAGLVVLTLGLLQTPLLSRARLTLWDVVVGTTGRLAGWQHLRVDDAIQAELERLRSHNIRLQAENADYVRLREQLGSPSFTTHQVVPALITHRTLDPWQTRLVINRGARDGITLGAPVVVYESTLVGHVVELGDRTSIIQLLLHPQTSLPAELLNSEEGRGLVRGSTHTALLLTTVPRDVEIESDQAVVSIADEKTPAGLVLGFVTSTTSEENEAYQSARLRLSYNPHALMAVSVLVAP